MLPQNGAGKSLDKFPNWNLHILHHNGGTADCQAPLSCGWQRLHTAIGEACGNPLSNLDSRPRLWQSAELTPRIATEGSKHLSGEFREKTITVQPQQFYTESPSLRRRIFLCASAKPLRGKLFRPKQDQALYWPQLTHHLVTLSL
jgi:hypothetical protein